MPYTLTHEELVKIEARGAKLAQQCNGDVEEILAVAYHALQAIGASDEAMKISDIIDDEQLNIEA